MPTFDASHSSSKVLENLSETITSALVRIFFIFWKEFSLFFTPMECNVFLHKLIRGEAM